MQYPSFSFNFNYLYLGATPPENVSIPVIESISTLRLGPMKKFHDEILNQMARNFINLEVVEVEGNLNDIRPFVCHASKLKQISFGIFTGENVHFSDVKALNEQRKRLANAHKITIFIDEENFMALKWSSNSSLIEWKAEARQ